MLNKRLVAKGSIIFLLFVMIFVSGCATTQEFYMKTVTQRDVKIRNDMKIAVIPENWYLLGVSNFFPRALITEFLDMGFTVIERSQLEKIFNEVKLDTSGAVKEEKTKEGRDFGVLDKSSIKKVGELLGVDALLLTYIVPTYEGTIDKATIRLVDTRTAKILFSITFINSKAVVAAPFTAPKKPVPTSVILEAITANINQLLQGRNKILSEQSDTKDYQIIIRPLVEKKKRRK